MNTIEFSITIVINFLLKIIGLNPATDIGEGWSFEKEINGAEGNDGITAFKEAIQKAALLPKEEGRKLLFATGLAEGATSITGEDKIKALSKRALADPDLGWSLYKEEGQKTLRYLHDTYGVTWMEFLRRVLRSPGGSRVSLYLYRGDVGSWVWSYYWLDDDRNASIPALALGE